jgi:hypothetical protein
MNKIFFLFLFFASCLFGANTWDHQFHYKLKKDELANIVLYKTKANSKELKKSEFIFRWTLVVKDRVTVLVNNQGYPHQYILYKKHSLKSIRLPLIPDGSNRLTDNAYILLVLSDINRRNNEVNFDIFIKDQKKRILVDFKEPGAK